MLKSPTLKQAAVLQIIADHEWMIEEHWWEVADVVMYGDESHRSVASTLGGLYRGGWLEREEADNGYPTGWILSDEAREQIGFFAPATVSMA